MDPEFFGDSIEERVVTLAAGDRLALFTDGVIEALSPVEEEFGEARFLGALSAHPHGRPQGSVEAVFGAIEAHVAEASPFDDMTLLVADIVPTPVEIQT
jgi:sigma-B regulation protein RsbU (phosphoserine phosphatase)